jgi:zinc protease
MFDHGISYNGGTEHVLTRFFFKAPADTMILKSLCLALQDWLSGQTSLQKNVLEAEKKIVTEESLWSGIPTTGDLVAKILYPSKYSDALAQRHDLKNKIAALSDTSIRRFYNDWYHPNLAGLTIVGDIDVDMVEQIIRTMFGDISNATDKKYYKTYPIRLTGKNKFITDTYSKGNENTFSASLFYFREYAPKVTFGDYKVTVMMDLFNEMMRSRMNDLYKNSGGISKAVVNSHLGTGLYADRSLKVNTLGFSFYGASPERGLKIVLTESERIKRFGFSKEELEKARLELLSFSRQDVPVSLEGVAEGFREHFIYGEAVPSESLQEKMRAKFLKEITVDEINRLIKSWINDKNRDVIIQAPENLKSSLPNEVTVSTWLKEIQHISLLQYRKKEEVEIKVNFDSCYHLVAPAPYARKEIKDLGLTELTLANGIKVIIKPATSPRDRVYLQGIRPLGADDFSEASYFSAKFAAQLVLQAGLGELSKEVAEAYKKEHQVSISANINDFESNISGASPSGELEIMLQLIYRYFLYPGKDSIAYNRELSNYKQGANGKRNSVSPELSDLLGYRAKLDEVVSVSELQKIAYNLCLQSYNTCFSASKDFVFVLTGVKDIEKTIALANLYIGNLRYTPKDPLVRIAKIQVRKKDLDVQKVTINKNLKEDVCDVFLFYSGYYPYSVKEKIKLEILSRIIKSTCYRRVREREAGTYALYSGLFTRKMSLQAAENLFEMRIVFQCSPQRSENLIQAALEEIEILQQEGPAPDDFNASLNEVLKGGGNLNQLDDRNWRSFLIDRYKDGGTPSSSDDLNLPSITQSITPLDIQKAAQTYLTKSNLVRWLEVGEGK